MIQSLFRPPCSTNGETKAQEGKRFAHVHNAVCTRQLLCALQSVRTPVFAPMRLGAEHSPFLHLSHPVGGWGQGPCTLKASLLTFLPVIMAGEVLAENQAKVGSGEGLHSGAQPRKGIWIQGGWPSPWTPAERHSHQPHQAASPRRDAGGLL